MKILDLTAGRRAIWFDKDNPLCTYLDIREEMNPNVVCDTRSIPAEVGDGYTLIVYDPPHLPFGPNSDMGKRYGNFSTFEILDSIRKSSAEAHRVSAPNALMAFKWNTHDIKLPKVLNLMARHWEPLFGHHTKFGHKSQTFWVMLRRLD